MTVAQSATESSAGQLPKIAFAISGSNVRWSAVQATAKQGFARRLVEAMLDKGLSSARNAKSGVDVAPLARTARVTREMARRYTQGEAFPDPNRMQSIAEWLGVRTAWLRDGDGDKFAGAKHQVEQPAAAYPQLSEEAMEIATVYMRLPPERRDWFRNLMMLEAIVANHYPWLMFGGRPHRESYDDYERRVERDLVRIADRLQKVK